MKITVVQAGTTTIYVCDAPDLAIGRAAKGSNAQVQIENDPSISRRHLRAWMQGLELWVEDLGSTWGTRINGQVIESPTRAFATDYIQIGDSVLSINADSAEGRNGVARSDGQAEATQLPDFLRRRDE